jgi:succinate dehydrogenase/fumarate reductase flavoprotein subunit
VTAATTTADVVVVGAGMAGLAAAVTAAELGARVTVVDKAPRPGGTVPLMGGFLWTATDLPTFMGRMTHADPELAALAVTEFEPSVAWVGQLGVTLGPRNDHFFEWGRGYPMTSGAQQYVDVLTARLAALGGSIRLRSPATGLELRDDGSAGAVSYVDHASRQAGRIECRAAVIATGGFAADPEMLTRYMGRWADRMFLRATPWPTGDGIRMARDVGARPSRGYHAYYGQLMPAPPARIEPDDFRLVTQYNSIHMIVVNLAGERFVDESVYDSLTAQALTYQERALGFLITDSAIDAHDRRHPATPTSPMPPTQRMRHIRERGGTVIEADSADGLAAQLAEHGVYRPGFAAALAEYDAAASAGTATGLRVPKTRHAHPIGRPPLYAIPVVPGISFTHGGLAINARTEVLDGEGSPIPGLYAAGADAGGLFYEQYLGGAATALVLGRTAGTGAGERAASG